MFRQKMAEVTDCSCRLIPSHSDQHKIFKTINPTNKAVIKEPKEKYSLKGQNNSSNKHQNKFTSAQNTSLRTVKQNQDNRLDASSPENVELKKLEQDMKFYKNLNGKISSMTEKKIKPTEDNRLRKYKQNSINIQNYQVVQNQENEVAIANKFENSKNNNQKEHTSNVSQVRRKTSNLQQYYKYVSNPYSAADQNKQNIFKCQAPHTPKYKIDLKLKRQSKKNKEENRSLKEINANLLPEYISEPDDQYREGKQTLKTTFLGSSQKKNSSNSHTQSVKASKYSVYLMNPKSINCLQNKSFQFYRPSQKGQIAQTYFNNSELFSRDSFKINHTQKIEKKHLVDCMTIGLPTKQSNNFKNLVHRKDTEKIFSEIQRPYCTMQNSKVDNMTTLSSHIDQNHPKSTKRIHVGHILQLDHQKQPIIIQKINTLNDLINKTAQCESILEQADRSYNENEQSIVILRHKDLIEEVEGNQKVYQKDIPISDGFLLGVKSNQNQGNNKMIDSIMTNVKPSGRLNFNINHDGLGQFNENLKKTVKVIREY